MFFGFLSLCMARPKQNEYRKLGGRNILVKNRQRKFLKRKLKKIKKKQGWLVFYSDVSET